MSEYISVGDLALDLRTSKQKLGRLIREYNLETNTMKVGRKRYRLCVATKEVEKIKRLIKTFKLPKWSRKCEEKRKRLKTENEKEPGKTREERSLEELFEDPIISVDLKSGVTGGQGIEAYWAKERWRWANG
jgi:hypothetical protein